MPSALIKQSSLETYNVLYTFKDTVFYSAYALNPFGHCFTQGFKIIAVTYKINIQNHCCPA